ncbi:invasin, partial [Vibrio metschnikovii]|nr:invasin [Vibrio metschnikovii]
DGFVSEPLNIALFDAKTAGAYCKAKGGRLPEKSEMALITNNQVNQLASKAKWPQGLSYWVESLSSGELSVYNDINPSDASVPLVASVACLNLNIMDFKIRDPKYIVIDTFKDLVVTYTNATGEKSIYTKGLKWETSDPNIISIDSQTGRAIGQNKGIATISVTSLDNKLTDSIEVEVTNTVTIVGGGANRDGFNLASLTDQLRNTNTSNAIFRSSQNFGNDGAVVKLRADFVFEDIRISDLNLRRALTRDYPPSVIQLNWNFSTSATTANLLRDYLYDGGVVMHFTEDLTESRRVLQTIFGERVRVERISDNGGGGVFQFEDIDDPILNGPFGDIRNGYWGQDYFGNSYVYNLPENSYVSLSNGYDWSRMKSPTNDNRYKEQSTALRHKRLKFVWVGDNGFTAFRSNDPVQSINNKLLFPFVVRNYTQKFDDPAADWHPATKAFGIQNQYQVSNSIMYANAISWLFGSVQSQD